MINQINKTPPKHDKCISGVLQYLLDSQQWCITHKLRFMTKAVCDVKEQSGSAMGASARLTGEAVHHTQGAVYDESRV